MLDIPQYDPHAPKKIEDIVGNQEIWQPLAQKIRSNNCSHFILCGPAGCGKSTFLRILFGEAFLLLVIDCTANPGLRDLRDALRGFARGSRTIGGNYRWVLLEHADSLAADTQAFLRRMMETTSNTTRFMFECSDAGAISEPILSRSTLMTVDTPTEMEFVYEIRRRTDNHVSPSVAEKLYLLTGGNMRNALYNALAMRWNGEDLVSQRCKDYEELLKIRPTTSSEWIAWATKAEKECRLRGYDCRELIMMGWAGHPAVSYMRSQWSRLGGISSRALFYRAVCDIAGALPAA